jgi:integrase/recombinase XerD
VYKEDVREFIGFTGLNDYVGLRSVVRSHIISWRKDMEKRGLAPSSIRRKLSALSSLFDYLCERNAVAGNPLDGVSNGNEGSTPALGTVQARKLLEAPPGDTLKGVGDRAILATLLYHGNAPRRALRLKGKRPAQPDRASCIFASKASGGPKSASSRLTRLPSG